MAALLKIVQAKQITKIYRSYYQRSAAVESKRDGRNEETLRAPSAVGIGNPRIWALAAFGQPGVEAVIDIYGRERAAIMR